MAGKKADHSAGKRSWLYIIATIVVALAFLVGVYYSGIGVVNKWVLGIASMFLFGIAIQRLGSFSGAYGLYMLGSRRGIKTVDSISRRGGRFWDNMALLGLVLGFGIFSYFLLKDKKPVFVFGLAVLILILVFVLPFLSYGVQFLNLPQLTSSISASSSSAQSSSTGVIVYVMYAVAVLTGFCGYTFFLIWYNAGLISFASYNVILSAISGHVQTSALANQVPGVAPIIPGIDIPLFAGIISLVILLIIHEFSHGILARRAKVKLKSIGFLLFGIIPIGAFVEPDEKEVEKLNGRTQSKIFSAGISANFIAMLAFFAVMVPMIFYVVPNLYHTGVFVSGTSPGYPANGILKQGMQILSWNGYLIKNLSSFSVAAAHDYPGSIVRVTTDTGSYAFTAIRQLNSTNSTRGLIGVEVYQKSTPINSSLSTRSLLLIYSIVALSFMLNFLVAVVNLLPIPGFDGWRIFKTNVKHDAAIKALAYLLLIGLLLNALPWIPILLG